MATTKSTKKTAKRVTATRSATRKTGGTRSRSLSSSQMEDDDMPPVRSRTSSSNQSGKKITPTNITGFGSKPASRTKSSGETSTGNKSAGSKSRTGSNLGSGQMQKETNPGNEKNSQG